MGWKEWDAERSIEQFGIDLVAQAKGGSLGRAHGRDEVVEAILEHIRREGNRSLVLVGPPGVGKTCLVREVAHRLAGGRGKKPVLLQTSCGVLMSDTRYLGEWQTRAKRILDEAAASEGRLFLYLTDAGDLMSAGTHSKSDESLGRFFAPAVEAGRLAILGECTPEVYRRGFEPFPEMKRLLPLLRVQEPPAEVVREIVRRAASERTAQLTESVLDRIHDLAGRFYPGEAQPGRTIRLLDLAIGVAGERESTEVAMEDVFTALEGSTGIPTLLFDDARPLDLGEVRRFFESRVLGQAEAVEAVVDRITLVKAGLTDPKKPMGVLLFVGPTGVGKTELVKALAEFVFGSEERMVRFDMSEYKDYSSFEKLIGDPKAGPRAAVPQGSLLTAVREQPFRVILFDELEKAHPNVFDLFLQLFDDGRLSDPSGTAVDFTQTIVVMTSNVGSAAFADTRVGFGSDRDGSVSSDVLKELKEFFRPEFLNRIDRIVVFRSLDASTLRTLVHRELGRVWLRSGIGRRRVRVDVEDSVIERLLAEGVSPEYGARPLKRAVERLVLLPVARRLVKMGAGEEGALLRLRVREGRLEVSVVAGRESPRAESPGRGEARAARRHRADLAELEGRYAELGEKLEVLREKARALGLEATKSSLLAETHRVDFWDDPPRAARTMTEIYRLERLLDSADRVAKRVEDAGAFLAGSRERADARRLRQLSDRLGEVESHLDVVAYSLHATEGVDRCDAYIAISLIDAEPAEDDPVGLLAGMYAGWANSKGFAVTTIDEDPIDARRTRRTTLFVDGVAVYGVLASEEGVHEFAYGRGDDRRSRLRKYAKVEVLPALEEEGPALAASDVEFSVELARGRGRRIPTLRSLARLVHGPTQIRVEARTDLEAEPLRAHLVEVLRARLARRDRPAPDGHEPVRRYVLGPERSVRDSRKGTGSVGLDDLFGGALDEFLLV